MKFSQNIFKQSYLLAPADRQRKKGHRPFILWFTGLSGAGKSTLAGLVEKALYEQDVHTYILDGDNMRMGLSRDLGFSDADRVENIRRVGEVAKLMIDAGLVVLTAFISPFKSDRRLVRSLVKQSEFIEVFVKCPLAECEKRDPKGLYLKARSGEIKNFTGIDSVYEEPENAEIIVDTQNFSSAECVKKIVAYIKEQHGR